MTETPKITFHALAKADACEHDWQGWRDFEDLGGETVCAKCGMGAMHHSLMIDDGDWLEAIDQQKPTP